MLSITYSQYKIYLNRGQKYIIFLNILSVLHIWFTIYMFNIAIDDMILLKRINNLIL